VSRVRNCLVFILCGVGVATAWRVSAQHAAAVDAKAVVWSADDLPWTIFPALAGARQVSLWGDATREPYGALKAIKAGTVVEPHTHSSLSRFLVLSGTLRFVVSSQAPRNLGRQSYGSIPAGVVHSATCLNAECVYFETSDGPYDFRPASQR